jgi:glycosyltransferase involved in cell wall biosynthesis
VNGGRNINILHVNSGYQGSIKSIISRLIKESRQEGYKSYIATPSSINYSLGKTNNHIRIGNFFDRNLHRILYKITGLNGYFSWLTTKRFLRKIDKVEPDIVHLHNLHSSYINIFLLFEYLKTNDIKIIWTFHDCWPFTGKCPHFENARCYKWEKTCYDCPQLHQYPSTYFDQTRKLHKDKKKLFNLIDIDKMKIITPSEWLKNNVEKSFLKEYSIKVINNGVSLDVFKPTNSNLREKYNIDNKFILLGVAFSWSKYKGLDVFIDLNRKLDDKFQIVLVGLSKKQINQLPNDIIKIQRTSSREELAKIYTIADVFINPTRQEVLGLVNIEALACGTPVITFNSGGSPETINEKCGFVVEKDNIDELIKSIYKAKKNPISSDACIKQAEGFEENLLYDEYINVYRSLLKK